MEYLTQFLIPVAIWFQGVPGLVISFMKGITFLGNTEFYLLFMPLLFWCLDITLGMRIGVLLLISGGLSSLLKFGFHSPRPFWVSSQVKGLAEGPSFGFPSGHAQNAAGIWGLFATSRKNLWIKYAAILLIILIGLSRLILGVHYLHDVIVGWLVGGILLFTFIKLEPGVIKWFKQNPVWKQIMVLVFVTAMFILIALPFAPPFNPPDVDPTWIENAGQEIDPYSYDELLTTSGSLFGLGLGIIFLNQRGSFTREGTPWQLILRYLVGITGVLALYLGLGLFFPDGRTLIAYILRFFRYSLIGFWISFAAPQVFAWMKLTKIKST